MFGHEWESIAWKRQTRIGERTRILLWICRLLRFLPRGCSQGLLQLVDNERISAVRSMRARDRWETV